MNYIDTSEIIKGHDFNHSNNPMEIMESYKRTGIQADNLAKAFEIIDKMLEKRQTDNE